MVGGVVPPTVKTLNFSLGFSLIIAAGCSRYLLSTIFVPIFNFILAHNLLLLPICGNLRFTSQPQIIHGRSGLMKTVIRSAKALTYADNRSKENPVNRLAG